MLSTLQTVILAMLWNNHYIRSLYTPGKNSQRDHSRGNEWEGETVGFNTLSQIQPHVIGVFIFQLRSLLKTHL